MMPAKKKKPSLAMVIGLSKEGPKPKDEHEDMKPGQHVEDDDEGAYGDAMTEFIEAVHAKDVGKAREAYGVLHKLESTKPRGEEEDSEDNDYEE